MIWLFSEPRCTRAAPHREADDSSKEQSTDRDLLMAERLHGVETSGARRRIQTGKQADDDRKTQRCSDQPPRHIPEVFRLDVATAQINIGAEIDGPANHPAKKNARCSAQHS